MSKSGWIWNTHPLRCIFLLQLTSSSYTEGKYQFANCREVGFSSLGSLKTPPVFEYRRDCRVWDADSPLHFAGSFPTMTTSSTLPLGSLLLFPPWFCCWFWPGFGCKFCTWASSKYPSHTRAQSTGLLLSTHYIPYHE